MYVRLFLIGVSVLVSARVFGQTDPSQSFDVASVKLSKPGLRGWLPPHMTVEPGGQRFTATNATVKSLIVMAYGLKPLQVSAGPAWLDSDGFDVDAKTEVPVSRDRICLMLQTLLSERFTLTLRRELRASPITALVVVKDTPTLRRAADVESEPRITLRGTGYQSISVSAQNVTLPFLADYLSGRLQQIVADKTGLTGTFDFVVELTGDPEVSERDGVSYMFNNLVKRIGLKLQPDKMQLDFITVEHAEKPRDN